MRTIEEISEQIDATEDSNNFGMSYEDGVKYALEWVIEQTDEKPIEIEQNT